MTASPFVSLFGGVDLSLTEESSIFSAANHVNWAAESWECGVNSPGTFQAFDGFSRHTVDTVLKQGAAPSSSSSEGWQGLPGR